MKIAVVCCEMQQYSNSVIKNLAGGACKISASAELFLWNLSSQKVYFEEETPFLGILQWDSKESNLFPEQQLWVLSYLYSVEKPDYIIFPDDTGSNELAGRLARQIKAEAALHVTDIQWENNKLFTASLAYNGNLTVYVEREKIPLILTLAKGCFGDIPVENIAVTQQKEVLLESTAIDGIEVLENTAFEDKSNLQNAKKVIICGHGVGAKANVKKVEELASLIGGEIGGSRPAIIEGWLGQDSLVGISGKVITPDICIMLGVSGAAAFFAGVRKSKTIIAVNSDPEAIVFQKCDYVVIEDCMKVVDSLCSCLNSEVD